MRKFKLFSLLILLVSAFVPMVAFAYPDDGSVADKWSNPNPNDPYKIFTLVRYPSTSANEPGLSKGDVVIWDTVSDDGVTVNISTSTGVFNNTSSIDAVAGVIVSTLIPSADQANSAGGDINRRNWGWMQVYGYNSTVNITGGNALAGTGLVASNTVPRYATTAVATLENRSMGFAFDASSQGQSEAFVDTI